MSFLLVIIIITALWSPANAVTGVYPDGLIANALGTSTGTGVGGGIGAAVVGILGLTAVLGAFGGAAGTCPSCPPVMSCPSCPSCPPVMSCPSCPSCPPVEAVCTTELKCGTGYTEKTVNGGQTCYQILTIPFPHFEAAQMACANTGGSLVSISNQAELIVIRQFLTESDVPEDTNHYTGIRDIDNEGPGAISPLLNICTGDFPDFALEINVKGEAQCAVVSGVRVGIFTLETNNCQQSIPAICEQGLINISECTATTETG